VEACLSNRVKRLIHTSTCAVYEEGHELVMDAAEVPPPAGFNQSTNYGRTKALGEAEIRKGIARGLDAVILNPPHIIGKYDTTTWAKMIFLINEQRLPGVGPGSGSFSNGGAVAEAHIAAYFKGQTGANYIVGGPHHTMVEFAQIIGRVLGGKKTPSRPLPGWFLKMYAAASEAYSDWISGTEPVATQGKVSAVSDRIHVSSAKAVSELGFNDAIPLEQSVIECVDYLKRIHML